MPPPRLPSDQDASGRSFGPEELDLLREVLDSGALTSTRGDLVRRFEAAAAQLLGAGHAVACASGSAAVHTAVAAVDPEPGDEVVTTSVTDMGALTPILYQGAIPVFADVDPTTGNVTAETVAAVLSERTRAVIVTHLLGRPVDMAPVLALGAARGIPVIEDAAQAWLARDSAGVVGTLGQTGCLSLQQGKHVTCGEGGLVVTDDAEVARIARTFVNKSWPYGEPDPDHRSIALNYRLSELQGAVALAQLGRLAAGVQQRRAMAARLSDQLSGLPGVATPSDPVGGSHSYWRYPLLVDPEVVPGGPAAVARHLRGYDVASAPRYINKPAFRCAVFTEQKTFGSSRWPFTLARPEAVDHDPARFPGTYAYLDQVLVLPWNERYDESHVDHLAESVTAAVHAAHLGHPVLGAMA